MGIEVQYSNFGKKKWNICNFGVLRESKVI